MEFQLPRVRSVILGKVDAHLEFVERVRAPYLPTFDPQTKELSCIVGYLWGHYLELGTAEIMTIG